MTVYIVQFDKTFLSGNLEGLTVPGQICTYGRYAGAQRHAALLQRVERDGDFMRDAVTGARYTPSNIILC